jgi:DNA-3-methyladenine glycosylase II
MTHRAIQHLQSDPIMARLISHCGPCELKPRRLSPFQSLTQAIIHQQLSGQAAGTILKRFEKLYGDHKFPSPKQVLETTFAKLRSAGLSRGKATYIHGLARHAVDGGLPTLKQCDSMTDAEMLENLTAIKGVGRWTAEMLLIFNLGRPDVLPVHDLGIRRGYKVAYRKRQMPTPEQLDRQGVKWSPYRSTAAWYLWRAADFLEGEKF